MFLRKKIQEVILFRQKAGQSFSFLVDIDKFEQHWYVLTYLYYEFKPEIKCNYLIEKIHVKNGALSKLEELEFKTINPLLDYLEERKVNPEYLRAMH